MPKDISSSKSGTAPTVESVSLDQLVALLASMDEWMANDGPLMIEDVCAWRDQLARALGVSETD